MELLMVLLFLFAIGSMTGWFIELFYRRFTRENLERNWLNPGFLVGPCLPLYGFGLCALYILSGLDQLNLVNNQIAERIILFILMAVVMTIIEYIAGIIFIKKMKVELWDYSDEWCNLQGIICVKYSVIWAILGVLYYFVLHPYILDIVTWISNNPTFSFVIGFFYGILFIDLGYSAEILKKIRTFAIENDIVMKYELLKEQIGRSTKGGRERIKFLLPFHSKQPLSTHLKRYLELAIAFEENQIKGRITETTKVIKEKTKIKKNKK